MKKLIALVAALMLALSMIACGGSKEESSKETTTTAAATTEATTEKTEEETTEAETEPAVKVMSYDEFLEASAENEDPVVVETYVQATQSWWQDTINVYSETPDGAYFIYNMACSEEDAKKLTPGTKIRVSGRKSAWSGEVEIIEATFEFVPGDTYIADSFDATSLLWEDGDTESLAAYMNQKVMFSRMEVLAQEDGSAFLYNYDGSGQQGDDLYFTVQPAEGGEKVTMTVESYLCGPDTDVYKAVEALNVGDVIDIDGFLYWYEGPNPHVTGVAPTQISSYQDFLDAEMDSKITVNTFVVNKQSWWDGKGTFYTQSQDGAYFLYEMECSEDDYYDLLAPGMEIRVTGYKSEWAGEVELIDATFEPVKSEAHFFEPLDVTAAFAEADPVGALQKNMNRFVEFKGFTVEAADESGAAFLYKYDGSGEQGDDLYFKVSKDGAEYTFTVESYLCDKDTDVYKAVEALKVGDVIDMQGFLYWYEGPNPHITEVKAAK